MNNFNASGAASTDVGAETAVASLSPSSAAAKTRKKKKKKKSEEDGYLHMDAKELEMSRKIDMVS